MGLVKLFACTVFLAAGIDGSTLQYISVEDQNPLKILEGGNVDIFCNSSGHTGYHIFWESDDKVFRLDGNELLITNITRGKSGLYGCYATNATSSDIIQYVVIEVLYPAKILSWSSPYNRLFPNDTYDMVVKIEGNPPPDRILLISDQTGDVLFRDEGDGVKNVTIESVQCGDTGIYHLRVVNDFNSAHLIKNITVFCVPYVSTDTATSFETSPRLGETAVLEMHAAGYPPPKFTWLHDGQQVQHTDDGYISKLTLENIDVSDYGLYQLVMENSVGESSYIFQVIPSGPPEPPTNLTFIQSAAHSAVISWVPGYDYNDTQTFEIISYEDEEFKVLHEFEGVSGNLDTKVVRTVNNLKSSHFYNISLIARNRNGTSSREGVERISFFTKESSPSAAVIAGILSSPFVVTIVFSFAIWQSTKWRRRKEATDGGRKSNGKADTNDYCKGKGKADDSESEALLHGSKYKTETSYSSDDQANDSERKALLQGSKYKTETSYSSNGQVSGYVAPENARLSARKPEDEALNSKPAENCMIS